MSDHFDPKENEFADETQSDLAISFLLSIVIIAIAGGTIIWLIWSTLTALF